jgi:hypothetical protein
MDRCASRSQRCNGKNWIPAFAGMTSISIARLRLDP